MPRDVWVAVAPIYYNDVRAHNPNDIVPDDNVEAYDLDGQGLVERVTIPDDAPVDRHGIDPVTQSELDALTTGPGRLSDSSLRAAFGSLAGDNVFAGANDFDQAPTVDGVPVATTGGNVFTGTQRINGAFGLNATATTRQPFNSVQVLAADAPGTQDKVAHAIVTTVTGDLATGTGSNPNFAWGLNVFTATGSAAGDGAGGTIQNLVETSVRAASGTISVAQGLVAEAAFFGSGVGATVTQMESLRVASPKRKDGATGGVATSAYGLFVETVSAAAVGATGSVFAVFVEGGTSRFGGRVDVTNVIANNGSGDLQLFAGFAAADGGHLQLMKAAGGGHVRARMATTNAEFQVHDNTNATWAVTRGGIPKWTAAANAQTTVGAAGGASALPATPTKYLKVQDSAGTTFVVPVYAAS